MTRNHLSLSASLEDTQYHVHPTSILRDFRHFINTHSDELSDIHHVPCSIRLYNAMRANRLEDNPIEFLALDDSVLMRMKNFGRSSLEEVNRLREQIISGELFISISNSTDIITLIDNFILNNLKNKYRDVILDRLNVNGLPRTLKETGALNNITRERARQICTSVIQQFLLFCKDVNSILNIFFTIVVDNLRPIMFSDFDISKSTTFEFIPNFYCNFLSAVFPCIPFRGNPTCYYDDYSERDLIEIILYPNSYNLLVNISDYSLKDKLKVLNIAFSSSRLDISRDSSSIFINKKRYSILELCMSLIVHSLEPVHIDDIICYFEKSDFYSRSPNRNSITARLADSDEFLLLDKDLWGLKEHMSYKDIDWPRIQEACRNVIENARIQIDASIIFDKVRNTFPKLRSKYEIVIIMRHDQKLKDLGFFTFVMNTSKQKERIKIIDVIEKIFESNPNPLSLEDMISQVEKVRSFPKSGSYSIIKQIKWLRLYLPSYFGLNSRHDDNVNILMRNRDFIKVCINHYHPNTNIGDIINYIGYKHNEGDMVSLLNADKDVVIVNNNGKIYFLLRSWSDYQIVLSIIANSTMSLFLEQIFIIVKDNLEITINDRKKIRNKLLNDVRIIRENDGSYKYFDYKAELKKCHRIISDIYDYLGTKNELIDINEILMRFESELRLNNIKQSEELITLLKIDNRFIVLADTIVGQR